MFALRGAISVSIGRRPRRPGAVAAVVLWTITAGCTSGATGSVGALLSVTPLALSFGTVPPEAMATGNVTVTNTGRTTLHVSSFSITNDPNGVFATAAQPIALAAGKSVVVYVTMTAPANEGVFGASLLIGSNASNAPTFSVQLGVLVSAAAPDGGLSDAGFEDAGAPDAGEPDAGAPDAGELDAGEPDGGPPDAGCPPGETLCNGACTTMSADPQNCGQCGQPCSATPPSTASCSEGICILTLASGGSYSPQNLAVDSSDVYWTAYDGTMTTGPQALIVKVPIGGGTPVTLATGDAYASGIAVSSSAVYYEIAQTTGSVFEAIDTVPLTGGTPVTVADNQNSALNMTAVDGGLYWTTEEIGGELVALSTVDGGTPVTLAQNQASPARLVVQGSDVYWVDENGNAGAVMRYDAIGGAVVTLIAQSWPNGVAVDANNVYWTTMPGGLYGGTMGQVLSLPLGGGMPATLAQNLVTPGPIVVTGTSLYWAEWGSGEFNGAITTGPVGGGTPVTLAPEQGEPTALVLSGESLYWVNSNGGHEIQRMLIP